MFSAMYSWFFNAGEVTNVTDATNSATAAPEIKATTETAAPNVPSIETATAAEDWTLVTTATVETNQQESPSSLPIIVVTATTTDDVTSSPGPVDKVISTPEQLTHPIPADKVKLTPCVPQIIITLEPSTSSQATADDTTDNEVEPELPAATSQVESTVSILAEPVVITAAVKSEDFENQAEITQADSTSTDVSLSTPSSSGSSTPVLDDWTVVTPDSSQAALVTSTEVGPPTLYLPEPGATTHVEEDGPDSSTSDALVDWSLTESADSEDSTPEDVDDETTTPGREIIEDLPEHDALGLVETATEAINTTIAISTSLVPTTAEEWTIVDPYSTEVSNSPIPNDLEDERTASTDNALAKLSLEALAILTINDPVDPSSSPKGCSTQLIPDTSKLPIPDTYSSSTTKTVNWPKTNPGIWFPPIPDTCNLPTPDTWPSPTADTWPIITPDIWYLPAPGIWSLPIPDIWVPSMSETWCLSKPSIWSPNEVTLTPSTRGTSTHPEAPLPPPLPWYRVQKPNYNIEGLTLLQQIKAKRMDMRLRRDDLLDSFDKLEKMLMDFLREEAEISGVTLEEQVISLAPTIPMLCSMMWREFSRHVEKVRAKC